MLCRNCSGGRLAAGFDQRRSSAARACGAQLQAVAERGSKAAVQAGQGPQEAAAGPLGVKGQLALVRPAAGECELTRLGACQVFTPSMPLASQDLQADR